MTIFDPWSQARELAEALHRPSTKLVIVLGAEGWCEKCRRFRPIFDDRSRLSPPVEAWLWLDLEDHAEFMGGYLPEDLPVLIQYQNGRLFRLETLEPTEAALSYALACKEPLVPAADPGLWQRLTQSDWAT